MRDAGHRLASVSGRLSPALAVLLAVLALPSLPASLSAQEAGSEALPEPGTVLEPGRYVSDAVGPTIDFRVGDGWIVGGAADGPIFTLERVAAPGTVLTFTRFDGEAFFESCDPTSATQVETTVPRLVEIIAGNPFLNAAPPDTIEVDGFVGLSLDVATPRFEECALPFLLLWALPMEDGEFVQVGGQQSRFVTLDVGGDVIVVAIESFPGVPFGGLLEASMDLVDSMRIEPGPYVPSSPGPGSTASPDVSPSPSPSAVPEAISA